jgi:hypothetical protein
MSQSRFGRGVSQIVDARAIRSEPGRVSIAELALFQRPALAIGVSSEPGSAGAAAADGALRRVSACKQLNLFGHALFFLEARIVGRYAFGLRALSQGELFKLTRMRVLALEAVAFREYGHGHHSTPVHHPSHQTGPAAWALIEGFEYWVVAGFRPNARFSRS